MKYEKVCFLEERTMTACFSAKSQEKGMNTSSSAVIYSSLVTMGAVRVHTPLMYVTLDTSAV